MTRTFRYRLSPSRAQIATLMSWLELTRDIYNGALQERKEAWERQGVRVTKYDQQNQIPAIRKECPEYATIPTILTRSAIYRVDRSFQAFFRRCKAHEKPGYPRFKPASRWHTLELDDLAKINPIAAGGRRVKVPLLGTVKMKYHRLIEGRPRTMRIKLNSDGHWYVSIICDNVEQKILPSTGKTVGVDLGVRTFAATSDHEMFENPRALGVMEPAIIKAQRRADRRKKGSNRQRQAAKLLAKKHAHVANIRRENHIVVAKTLVAKYDTIYVEDLDIKHLAKKWFAKPINDAAWGEFLRWLDIKAESAGRQVVRVDPKWTSDLCSGCGTMVPKTLADHVHDCPNCGLVLDRDINAAINILMLGMSMQSNPAAKSAKTRRPGHTRPPS